MKDLLVGTAFIDDSPIQRKWFDIQQTFLNKTTSNFDHFTIVTHKLKTNYYENKTILLKPITEWAELGGSRAHQQSLNIMSDFFLRHKDQYRYFLYLDCDAFPIRKNWLNILTNQMGNKEIAAIIRAENLELRLHASVLLAKPDALEHLMFVGGEVGTSISGDPEKDLHAPYYEKNRHLAFGMVRSNKLNVHPIACGVYYDMFYHHSNSRGTPWQEKSIPYWQHLGLEAPNFTEMLFENPEGIVTALAGWNTNDYVA